MKVTYVYADDSAAWNSANWRCAIPAEALNATRRHSAELCSIQDFKEGNQVCEYRCKDADVIVVQRHLTPDAWHAVQHWREAGKLLLIDIDDGYLQLRPDNPAYSFWFEGMARQPDGRLVRLPERPIDKFVEGVKQFDGLTSPNRLICADFEALGIRTAYVPNWAPTRLYLDAPRAAHDRPRILWGGSMSHVAAWLESGILYALAREITKRPQVEFAVCGADQRVADMIPLKATQKVVIGWAPFRRWPEVIKTADIGLAPMVGEYDARRSWIKPLEFSLCQLPWLGSESGAYTEYAGYGTLVPNTPEAWAQALAEALDQPPDAGRVRRAQHWAKAQDIADHLDEMCNLYAGIKKGGAA